MKSMEKTMRDVLIPAAAAVVALIAMQVQAEVKVVAIGWDITAATPEQILAKVDEFRDTGLDGVIMAIPHRSMHASNPAYRTIMTDEPWTKEKCGKTAETLRKITSRKWMRESFVLGKFAPRRRLRWDDDAAWKRFADNIGVLAWMAREGGLRGIFIDHEDYTKARQFKWHSSDGVSCRELAPLVRRRGAEVCAAVYREFPEAVLMATWFFSESPQYLVPGADAVASAMQAEDLWPSFLNGFIDAMPMTGRFVDGCENAYLYKAVNMDFYRSYLMVKRDALALVSPEIRWKYRALSSSGFGLYPDAYLSEADRKPDFYTKTMKSLSASPVSVFAANLSQAVRVADDYVWIFGERANYIDWKGVGPMKFEGWLDVPAQKTWNEKLPGFNDIVLSVKDPLGFIDKRFGKDTKAVNLIKNGACVSMDGYSTWIADWLKGKRRDGSFGVDKTVGNGDSSSLCAETVQNGCFTAVVRGVKEGEAYAFTVDALGRAPSVSMFWMKDGKGVFSIPEERARIEPGKASDWRRLRALWTVPAGVDAMAVRLETKLKRGEKIHYDNVGVYKVR